MPAKSKPVEELPTTPVTPSLGAVELDERPVNVRGSRKVWNEELLELLKTSKDTGKSYAVPFTALHENPVGAKRVVQQHAEHAGLSVSVVHDLDNLKFYAKTRITRTRKAKDAQENIQTGAVVPTV